MAKKSTKKAATKPKAKATKKKVVKKKAAKKVGKTTKAVKNTAPVDVPKKTNLAQVEDKPKVQTGIRKDKQKEMPPAKFNGDADVKKYIKNPEVLNKHFPHLLK